MVFLQLADTLRVRLEGIDPTSLAHEPGKEQREIPDMRSDVHDHVAGSNLPLGKLGGLGLVLSYDGDPQAVVWVEQEAVPLGYRLLAAQSRAELCIDLPHQGEAVDPGPGKPGIKGLVERPEKLSHPAIQLQSRSSLRRRISSRTICRLQERADRRDRLKKPELHRQPSPSQPVLSLLASNAIVTLIM